MLNVPLNYLDTLEDVKELIEAGAEEFYIGYMPKQWYQRYGWEISTNKRYFPIIPHIIDPIKAKVLVSFVHKHNRKIFLALNELYFSKEQHPLLFKIVELFERLNINGYIVSDLAFILALKKRGIKGEIHLSSCAGCYNLSTLSFFRKLGIKRFILPHKLSVQEIIQFLENSPSEVKLEIFLIGEWCKYSDAHCFSAHGFYRENFCSAPFKKYLVDKKHGSVKELNNQNLNRMPWCGLCIIPKLKDYRRRIIFKLPLREGTCQGINRLSLIKRLNRLLSKKDISRKQCRDILGDACRKNSGCAYQI